MNITLPFQTATVVNPDVLQTAQQAFTAHQHGVLTGDWTDLLLLMSDDVELQAPSPYLPDGSIHGRLNVARILYKVTDELQLTVQLTVLHPIVVSETTVAFEFMAKGSVAGQSFSSQMVVFYEIENCKIKCLREYAAKLDLKVLDQIMNDDSSK
ncbi:MAG TPA: nuclear transport factor 2 family protein [Crinalium sp.]|jgi:ketosteroid isomerase-like protein